MIQIAVPNLTGGEVDVSRSRLLRYNATLVRKIDVHDDLSIFRVKPDWPIPSFQAGQYVALGLGYWEPRVANTQVEKTPPSRWDRVVRRAYSISCSLLDERGQLIRVSDCDYLEFYITLVREAARPPALTPRMFGLEEGDRLFMEPHIVGRYTLDEVPPDDSVVLFGTGTGEAPHNAMITELLARGHRGRITCVTSV
ncbi:MAG: ferredoxin--NADP reductase, partial [Pirellulaceae bacterium]|nr:ferredoxin--NADP reductase [Pirellulaceae bacterium]